MMRTLVDFLNEYKTISSDLEPAKLYHTRCNNEVDCESNSIYELITLAMVHVCPPKGEKFFGWPDWREPMKEKENARRTREEAKETGKEERSKGP